MGYYDTPDAIASAARSRAAQNARLQKELNRKNKKREDAEAKRFADPFSGRPQKKNKAKRRETGANASYWRQRALAAESALRAMGGKPASGPTFYESRLWQDVRYKVLLRDGRVCKACGCTDKTMHVDHIKPRSKYPELEFELSNLQVLCVDCNLGKGAWDETNWREPH